MTLGSNREQHAPAGLENENELAPYRARSDITKTNRSPVFFTPRVVYNIS